MEAIPNDLIRATQAARERLGALSRSAAAPNAQGGNAGSPLALAGAAQQAIFADALLAATHARLEELRNAAK